MVALQRVESSTLGAIYKAYETARENYESHGLAIGSLGNECDAALWFEFRRAAPPEAIDGKKARLFETGNLEEARLVANLIAAGINVEASQEKVRAIGGHLRGKTDGKALGVPEAPKTVHVIECKTASDKRFKEIAVGVQPRGGGPLKQGVKTQAPSHYIQCQIYMHLLKLKRCLYLLVNKNTDEIYAERIEYDPAFALQVIARAERIISAKRAPAKISDDPTKYPCIFCTAKDVCHGETFARVNCRTCIHSTPVMTDADATNQEPLAGRWRCERHNKILTREEAAEGCPDHLYLPDLVPGEQIDAGDDWVSYKLKNGKEWRDGVSGQPK